MACRGRPTGEEARIPPHNASARANSPTIIDPDPPWPSGPVNIVLHSRFDLQLRGDFHGQFYDKRMTFYGSAQLRMKNDFLMRITRSSGDTSCLRQRKKRHCQTRPYTLITAATTDMSRAFVLLTAMKKAGFIFVLTTGKYFDGKSWLW